MIIKTKIGCNAWLPVTLSILTIFIFTGCQKIIMVDLNEAAPRIVIEGLITDRPGPYIITISKTASYFDQPVLPPVSGAIAVIIDETGTNDTLNEIKPGIYITSTTRGIPGKSYTLKVLSENKEYIGSSTMHSHVLIDSLSLIKSTSQRFDFRGHDDNKDNVDIYCFFNDPVEKNFYRMKVFTNDTIRTENYRLYDDQYTNGQKTDLRVRNAKAGDTVRIELLSLDKQTYAYYHTLEDLLHTNPIFGSTPANPNTNLSNGALGYFGACAISDKTIIITDSLINTVR